MIGKSFDDLTGPAGELNHDVKQVFALELVESSGEGIPYVVKEETGSSWLALALGLVSLCSCCGGCVLENIRARLCKRRQVTRSSQTEHVDHDSVKEGATTQVPRGRSMRPASGSDGRGGTQHLADHVLADRFARAEEMAHNFLKEDLQTLAKKHQIAYSGSKLEIALRLQGLSGMTRVRRF